MTKITVYCRGSYAAAKLEGQITTGMVGLPVELHWDAEWDGLAKALIFRNSQFPDAEQWAALAVGEEAAVPGTVLTQAGQLQVSAEGISRDGKRVLHTQWADCGKIRESGSTADFQEPEPSLVQQLMSRTDQAMTLAKEAKAMAAAGGGSVPGGLAAQVRKQQYELDNLKAAAEGKLCQVQTDMDAAWIKTVPLGALTWCSLDSFSGRSEVVDGTLVHADVTGLLVTGRNHFDSSKAANTNGIFTTGVGYHYDIYDRKIGADHAVAQEILPRLPRLGAGTYRWSADFDSSVTDRMLLNTVDGNGTILAKQDSYTYTMPIDAPTRVTLRTRSNKAGTFANMMICLDGDSREYAPFVQKRIPIPEEIRALPGYGLGAPGAENTVDLENGVYIQRCALRNYTAGDEEDETVVTDGVHTAAPLTETVIVDISGLMEPLFIEVQGGGSIEFSHEAEMAVPSQVSYLVRTSGGA